MKTFKYPSGEEVRAGDSIIYHGEPGHVDFIVVETDGDAEKDWYMSQFPGGGFMIVAKRFGNVFLEEENIDEDLEFVSRVDTGIARPRSPPYPIPQQVFHAVKSTPGCSGSCLTLATRGEKIEGASMNG
jgi:hypothetical protein